jgi:hypothetical protein
MGILLFTVLDVVISAHLGPEVAKRVPDQTIEIGLGQLVERAGHHDISPLSLRMGVKGIHHHVAVEHRQVELAERQRSPVGGDRLRTAGRSRSI